MDVGAGNYSCNIKPFHGHLNLKEPQCQMAPWFKRIRSTSAVKKSALLILNKHHLLLDPTAKCCQVVNVMTYLTH